MWQTNDSRWKTSNGPSFIELEELGGKKPPLNQCIGAVISSLRLDDATWMANFESLSGLPSGSERGAGGGDSLANSECLSNPPSSPEHGAGGKGSLHRVMSRDSWSTIHVNDNSGRTTRRLLDSIQERPMDIRRTSGEEDGMLLSTRPSIYPDALPLFQITPFWCKNLNGIIFHDMNFDVLA